MAQHFVLHGGRLSLLPMRVLPMRVLPMRVLSMLVLAMLLATVPGEAAAQQFEPGGANQWTPAVPPQTPAREATARVRPAGDEERTLSPLFLASALMPGAAQYLAGDERWVPYVAVEAWALVSHVQQRRLARSLEERYRDVAWQVARRVSVGARRDTVFEYYEAMAHYSSSGGWMPDGAPERQAGTYNGELWRLARALYFPGGQAAAPGSPAYEAALAFYLSRAVPPGYAWAWGASNLEQQVFVDLIAESDAAFRSATRYIGVILANHVTSAVEALITSRLRQLGPNGDALRLETGPSRYGAEGGWEYGVRIRF
jgi:hypothetical protein